MSSSRRWVRRLVHRNILATTITIGYIELHQGFEGEQAEEELNEVHNVS